MILLKEYMVVFAALLFSLSLIRQAAYVKTTGKGIFNPLSQQSLITSNLNSASTGTQ